MANRRGARAIHRRPAFNESAVSTRSEAVVEVLPYLRRYARAVTGSSDSGDRYVRQFARVFLLHPDVLAADHDWKLQCFMLFRDVCRGLDPAKDAVTATGISWIDRQLAALLPVSRELLLLVHLENFTVAQAARIVGIPESEADDHLLGARLAFRRAAPKFWSPAIAKRISDASAGFRADDPVAEHENWPQPPAWLVARTATRGSSRHRDILQTLRDPVHDGRLPNSGSGRMNQTQALESWETEGGATAPAKML